MLISTVSDSRCWQAASLGWGWVGQARVCAPDVQLKCETLRITGTRTMVHFRYVSINIIDWVIFAESYACDLLRK